MPASGLKSASEPWRWIPSLYLAEGLPNALVVTVAVVLLKDMGLDNGRVAFYTSLLYLPWVIKPFWAPFLDIFSTKRNWIIAMQALLFAGIAAIGLVLPSPWWLAASMAAFWTVAFASATHDIAADGFYMLALGHKDQAFFVGIRSTFYRLANLLASGGVVWAAGYLISRGVAADGSWAILFGALALLFMAMTVWHWRILPRPAADKPAAGRGGKEILRDLRLNLATFFRKPDIAAALAFMLLYRLPEALLCKMVQPFLLDPPATGGLGLSIEQVGLANGTFGVIGMVLGGITGGITVARYGLRRCLWPMALALTVPSGFYCYLAAVQPSEMWIICTGLAIEQFGYGFGFTAYMMYLMVFCEGTPYTTSHYAFCTGVMALGLMLPGLVAGKLQMALGYGAFFILIMALCLATFAVCWLIRRKIREN